MYRVFVKPKWLLGHLLAIALIVAMISLGFWQLRRLDERRDFNATVRDRSQQPAVPLDSLVPAGAGAIDVAALEYRPVEVQGTYVREARYELARVRDDVSGRDLYALLELADGTVVVVNRGWLPSGVPYPDPSAGPVSLVARVRESDDGGTGQTTQSGTASTDPVAIFRVDVEALASDVATEPRAMYVERITSDPAEPPELTPVPFPDLGEGSHFGYAVQWFLFSVCVLAGWILVIARTVGEVRHPERAAALDPDQPVF